MGSVLETETVKYFKMSRKVILKYLVWQLSVVLIHSKSMNTQINVILEAGRDHCYYLPGVEVGQTMEFEFMVTQTSGAEGKTDIDVTFSSPPPESRVLYTAKKHSEGNYNDEATVAGDFKRCLD